MFLFSKRLPIFRFISSSLSGFIGDIQFSMPKKIYFTDIIWGLKVLQSQLVIV